MAARQQTSNQTNAATAMASSDGNEVSSGRFRAQFWKTELCRFWRSGCRNGKLCPFAHGEDELTCRPDLCKTSLCQRWAKGACPLEANECRFAHGRLDLRATPSYMHGQGETNSQGQLLDEYGNVETEAVLLSTSGNNNNGNSQSLQGGRAGHPPPQMWEEDCFNDASAFMTGGASAEMMPWGGRTHSGGNGNGNEAILEQMQAVLAQREWQWSPEYGDGLQEGGQASTNGRLRRPRAGKMMASGGPIAAPAGVNGHPPQMHQQQQQQYLLLNGDGHQGSLAFQDHRPQQQQQQQQHQQPWLPPYRDNSVPTGVCGWTDGMQAPELPAQTYARGPENGFGVGPEVTEFPHAITAPGVNIMVPAVPQELRAIWN